MKKIENVSYEKLNYQTYQKRINELLKNEKLQKLGIKISQIGSTTYNYPLECITIGNGNKELFIVGGTHGSEIISVDFVTQLIENIPDLKEFDPNEFKLNIIPTQNPEGFDITTSTLSNINEDSFKDISFEYYKKYRQDNIIAQTLNETNNFFNVLINNNNIITANDYLIEIKKFINTNHKWKQLDNPRNMPKIKIFNNLINKEDKINNFEELKYKLILICNRALAEFNPNEDLSEIIIIDQLKKALTTNKLWTDIDNKTLTKLHQQMFKETLPNNIKNIEMKKDTLDIPVPEGSHILWDATGGKNNINLNANIPINPGIEVIKKGEKRYGPGAKNNIRNYFKGPLGVPTEDVNNFKYATENKALYKLINSSYKNGSYIATLLYHGTGGLIYYQPYENLMEEKNYTDFYNYNLELANIYQKETDYRKIESSDKTGYGDLLRRTFPGVLLIELSKMGGNPIAPYGDVDNIYRTVNENLKAINSLLKYFKEKNITLENNIKTIKK